MNRETLEYLPKRDYKDTEKDLYQSLHIIPTDKLYEMDGKYKVFTVVGYSKNNQTFDIIGEFDLIRFNTNQKIQLDVDKDNTTRLIAIDKFFKITHIGGILDVDVI